MLKAEITELRNRINEIDNSIAKLLSERVDCAVKIGELKDELRASSEKEKIRSYDSVREKQIIDRLKGNFPNLSPKAIEIIFRQIISFCRNSAHKSTVCIYGETKDFDYKQYFGDFCDYKICSDIDSFVEELKKSEYNIGITIKDKEVQEFEKGETDN